MQDCFGFTTPDVHGVLAVNLFDGVAGGTNPPPSAPTAATGNPASLAVDGGNDISGTNIPDPPKPK
jgi:hypothetical protein